MRNVNYQRAHIARLIQKITSKEQMLNSKLEFLRSKNQQSRVNMYLREMGDIAIMKRVLILIELGLTGVSERLDTLRILHTAISSFRPVAKSVEEAIQYASLLPMDFKDVMTDLAHSYTELVTILRPPDAHIFFDFQTPEASKIISQVEGELEREILNRFPSVPLNKKVRGERLADKMEEVLNMLVADGGTEVIFSDKSRKKKMSFEDKVLYYINMRHGRIDVFGCAKYLRASPQKVIEALYELAEDGRLKFNG